MILDVYSRTMSLPLKISTSSGPVPAPTQGAVERSDVFASARADIVAASAKYGSVGPGVGSGEASDQCDFFVVEDDYGDPRILIETRNVSVGWLRSIAQRLRSRPHWDVVILSGPTVRIRVKVGAVEIYGWTSSRGDARGIIADLQEYLRREARGHREHRDKRVRRVAAMLPIVWQELAEKSDVRVCGFRDRTDGVVGDSIWILHRTLESSLDIDDCTLSPEGQVLSTYWATASGSLRPDVSESQAPKRDGEVLVVEWVLVANGSPLHGARTVRFQRGEYSAIFHVGGDDDEGRV